MNRQYCFLILILPFFFVVGFVAHAQQTPTAEQMRMLEELQQQYEAAASEAEIRALDEQMDALFRQVFDVFHVPQNVEGIETMFQQEGVSVDQNILVELEELQQQYEAAASEAEIRALDERAEALFEHINSPQQTDGVEDDLREIRDTLGLVMSEFFPGETTAQNIREPITQTENETAFPLDVVWSAETLVPPGYTGKPRAVSGGAITLTALTPTQNPAEVEFRWVVRDSTPRVRGSLDRVGVGENTYTLQGHRSLSTFTHQLEVIATNVRTGQEARASVSIPLVRPEVHLYTAPHTMWATRVSQRFFVRAGQDAQIYARPFYFPTETTEGVTLSWELDRERVHDTDNLTISISSESVPRTERALRVFAEYEKPPQRSINRAGASVRMVIVE